MLAIADKSKCAGCSACMEACSFDAIRMIADDEGFYYPVVDKKLCKNCAICEKVCPFKEKAKSSADAQEAFVVKHRDVGVLKKSTSGGAFTALSDYVLDLGGAVYGAVYDENMVVTHIRATSRQERDRMRGSKYVQSNIGTCFSEVKRDLQDGKYVLFTGTPCQVAGLKSGLNGEYERLICCDLICWGVSSPLIFSEHIKLLQTKREKRIVDYQFRPKKWGYRNYKPLVCYEDGKEIHSTPYTDLYQSVYYSRIATRPSCNQCPYSNLERYGDITIGDCNEVENVFPDFGSFDGVSLMLLNTAKGKELFQNISEKLISRSVNINSVLQEPLRHHAKSNANYRNFFDCYHQHGYRKAINLIWGENYALKYYIKKFLKRI